MASITQSGRDLRIEGVVLRGILKNDAGEDVDASLDLNTILGNSDGAFLWTGSGFADSAENINLSLEQEPAIPVLRASLRNAAGELAQGVVNLAERVVNQNGQFVCGECYATPGI